jgi:hypothetical protein
LLVLADQLAALSTSRVAARAMCVWGWSSGRSPRRRPASAPVRLELLALLRMIEQREQCTGDRVARGVAGEDQQI